MWYVTIVFRIRPRDFLVPLTLGVTGVCLAWGGYATYVSLRNWSPTEVTCAELADHRTNARWLRLTECEPDFDRMGLETLRRAKSDVEDVTMVFVPMHVRGGHGRASVVVAGDDPDMLALGDRASPQATIDRVAAQFDGLIEGLSMSVLSMSPSSRQELHDLHLGLADDFIVLDRGARPRPLWLGLGVLGIGGAGVALIRRRRARSRRNRPSPLARATVVAG